MEFYDMTVYHPEPDPSDWEDTIAEIVEEASDFTTPVPYDLQDRKKGSSEAMLEFTFWKNNAQFTVTMLHKPGIDEPEFHGGEEAGL
jgi:hypothetical protein